MHYRYHDHGNIRRPLYQVVEERSVLLEKRLAHIEEDLKSLDITVDHHMRSDTYTTRLRLTVLNHQLLAHSDGKDLGESARGAFDDLFDQLEEFLAKLRREPQIRDERRKPAWEPDPSLPVDWEQYEEPRK